MSATSAVRVSFCTAAMLERLDPQGRQLEAKLAADPAAVLAAGPAFAARVGDVPIAAAGIYESRPPVAWALMSEAAGPHFVFLTRAVRRYLDLWPGVVCGVDRTWPAAERWARLVGFEPSGLPFTELDHATPHQLWRRPIGDPRVRVLR